MTLANIDALTQDALDHYLFPLARKDDMRTGGANIYVSAKGLEITDAAGKTYLDMMSTQTRASSLGYGQDRIAKAIYDQLVSLHYGGTVMNIVDVTVRLAAKIAELAPGTLTASVFAGSGSEANEMSFKAAKQYHLLKGEKPRAHKIIARWNAYHGATMGALAATDYLGTRHITEPGVPGYSHIPAPNLYRTPFGMDASEVSEFCADYLEQQILHEGPEYVAAFIAEPVMQADGVQVPPDDYFARVRAICDTYDVLFIADEVITGFGRTSQWFAMEHWGVQADIMSIGKAISAGYFPLGISTVSAEVHDTLSQYVHIQTYNGHPGGCAAALETIAILEEQDLLARGRENGAYFLERMQRLRDLPIVGDVRGLGMWTCVDFTSDKKTKAPFKDGTVQAIADRMAELGVLGGEEGTAIEFAPAYTASRDQLDHCVDITEQAIREIAKSLT
jgi:adenosylmethionine-8-amino-7-oxononanoate aminotransferase